MSTTKTRGRPLQPTVIRFVQKYTIKDNGCRQWTGAIMSSTKPYPILNVNGKNIIARTWAYREFVGDIPRKYRVVMTCQNDLCVNTEHMTLGLYHGYRYGWTVLPRSEALVLSGSEA